MKDVISIADFPSDKIYVLLDKSYRENLLMKVMHKLECSNFFELSLIINKKLKIKCNGGDIRYWLDGQRLDKRTGIVHPKFMPLFLVLFLIKMAKEKVDKLDKHIVAYRSGGKGTVVTKPILPIIVTPELDSIVIHLFADGTAGDFTPSYAQKNKHQLDNFIKKLENCFGNFKFSIYNNQIRFQVRFPKAITDIISHHYQIKSYMSYDSKIPSAILNRAERNYKLACAVSFIVDEGNIRDAISLYSVNERLLTGIRKLILDCGYGCSRLQFNRKSGSFLFTISTKDVERLYHDIEQLSNVFPTCNLSFKREAMLFLVNRKKIRNPRDKTITRKVILSILGEKPSSAQNISRLSNYAYCTIIHNLEKLYQDGLVKKELFESKTLLWSLNDKPTEFTKK